MSSHLAYSFRSGHRQQEVSSQVALPDWQEVSPGHDVSLYKKGQGHFHGRVDDVTADGAIIWVHLAGGWGRRMFARADGYHLTLHWSGTLHEKQTR